jgi:hypothetical protein
VKHDSLAGGVQCARELLVAARPVAAAEAGVVAAEVHLDVGDVPGREGQRILRVVALARHVAAAGGLADVGVDAKLEPTLLHEPHQRRHPRGEEAAVRLDFAAGCAVGVHPAVVDEQRAVAGLAERWDRSVVLGRSPDAPLADAPEAAGSPAAAVRARDETVEAGKYLSATTEQVRPTASRRWLALSLRPQASLA